MQRPEWQLAPDATYTAMADLTGTTFSTDLKSTGGLARYSTELTVDVTSKINLGQAHREQQLLQIMMARMT